MTGGAVGNWDGLIASAGFASVYGGQALEPFMAWPFNWSGSYDDVIPVLATSWEITPWPEEMNHHPTNPFMMTGGVKAIELTLREGVKFHDGSDFNATVAKWNIDRIIVMSGNLTGALKPEHMSDAIYKTMYSFWLPAEKWAPYETDTWNVSQFIGKAASYGEFGATKTPPNDPLNLYSTYYNGTYPRVKNVTITEDKKSGGKIKVYYNDWSSVLLYIDTTTCVSMKAYENYEDDPIIGLGDDPRFPQPDVTTSYPSTGFPGHLIGTGAYRFIEHDEVLQQGTMLRYDNWWNLTAMQANNYSDVSELAIVTFPLSQAGYNSMNLAMVTGTIDYAGDTGQASFYDDMVEADDVNYIIGGISTDRNFITLNAINETYWKTWADAGPAVYNLSDPDGFAGDLSHLYDVDDDGRVHVEGINRAMRKAVSYAFDYDVYINSILQGRGVRSGGFLNPTNEFYNPDIPLAYRNLTIARQALIDDPFWGPRVAARSLDINSPDADWVTVANSNPIFEFKLIWDSASVDIASVFGNSIKDLGLILGGQNGAPDPALEVQPDIYTVMFSGGLIGLVPWFTSHGVPSNWPGSDVAFAPFIEYYIKSPGIPYEPYSYSLFPNTALINNGFHYNATVDDWADRAWFVDRLSGQELWDNLSRHFQAYQYSDIFLSHSQWGYAVHKDWEYNVLIGTGGYQFVRYVGTGGDGGGVQIPGYETAAILVISIVTTTGIGLSLKRKRKRVKIKN
ncbi:MAG: ABC transporter substrate-binding protein [Promethearchaeota archaeon]